MSRYLMESLAFKLADFQAGMVVTLLDDQDGWLNIKSKRADREAVRDAVTYLELRGRLEHHHDDAGLVRLLPTTAVK